jgi:hypothetical protein
MIDLWAGVEYKIAGEEWQDLGHESSVGAPIWFSCCIVEFFRLMNNSEFIQLVRKGLIGVIMVKIGLVARPVELEPSYRFEVVRIFANHRFQIEVIAEAFHEWGIGPEHLCDQNRSDSSVIGKVHGGDLPVDDLTLCRLRQGRNSVKCSGKQSGCAEDLSLLHDTMPSFRRIAIRSDRAGRMAKYHREQSTPN